MKQSNSIIFINIVSMTSQDKSIFEVPVLKKQKVLIQ